ncbi:MAG: FAD-binding protein, partial [Acidobacteria bacterium]|nr:FAD-binding protein [Acidobacteriota bacterium]
VSRSEMTEILEGRGFKGPDGLDYVNLDLTHLGAEKINKRLPLIREVCMKFLGLDPIKEPIPIRPVAHYSMGGIEADINGKTEIENIWAAGEVACHSLHGANRLGCNSTAECLVYGGITGEEISKYLSQNPALSDPPKNSYEEEEKRIFEHLINKDGSENPYIIKKELRKTMDEAAGVYREGGLMQKGLDRIRELKEQFQKVRVDDKSKIYNSNLINTLETENLLDLAEILLMAAIERKESRGGHARTDFPKRDDENFLKHTLVRLKNGKIEISYKPVKITRWKPVERKY